MRERPCAERPKQVAITISKNAGAAQRAHTRHPRLDRLFPFLRSRCLDHTLQPVDRRVGRPGICRPATKYAIRPSPKKEGRLIYRGNPKAHAPTRTSPLQSRKIIKHKVRIACKRFHASVIYFIVQETQRAGRRQEKAERAILEG